MTLTEMLTALRLELADSGTFHTDGELTRAIQKTVALMSRFMPNRGIAETRIGGDVTSETLTIASNTGTLTYPPIEPGSLTITGETEGTDYEVNYLTGVVTEIGSELADGSYTAKYSRDPRIINFSSLVSSYIAIERLMYPAKDSPPSNPSFDIIGDYIILRGTEDLTEDEHIRIVYTKEWTAPATAAGDYPVHLDDVVIIGASGQALIYKAEKYVQSALTELALANAAADSMATPLADINTALDKVATYLETSDTTDNAKDVLANITDDVANLRTAIATALDLYSTYVTNGSTAPDAKKYLDDGDGLINTVNVGADAAANFAKYAEVCISMYGALVANASTRLENLKSYIEEAEEWRKIGETFISEAMQRNQEVYSWSIQAAQYLETTKQYLAIAGRYLASGQAKINEFLASLGMKPEFYVAKALGQQFA